MAEVLTPIVQQSGSITMLHTPTDAYQNNSTSQSHHQTSRTQQMSRPHIYNTPSGGIGYRGTSATPVAPYAFQSTPQLRQENRSSSAPSNAYTQQNVHTTPGVVRQGHASSSSESTTSSTSSRSVRGPVAGTRDDSTIQRTAMSKAHDDNVKKLGLESRPNPTLTMSTSVPDLSLATFDTPAKPSPGRYRRANRADSYNTSPITSQQEVPTLASRSATPSGSGLANVAHLYNNATTPLNRTPHMRTSSADDSQLPRQNSSEQAKRYRRRSVGGFEPNAFQNANPSVGSPAFAGPTLSVAGAKQETRPSSNPSRPISFHERKNSGESLSSSSTRPPSSRQDQKAFVPNSANGQHTLPPTRPANIPARGSSDTSKRPMNPSPLSQGAGGPGPSNLRPTSSKATVPSKQEPTPAPPSPAAQHLAALSDKDLNKGMKSRLRRAFSFGSSAELRKASAQNNMSAERAKLHKDRSPQDEMEAEQDAIAAKQEAGGIGVSIYSGQGNFFSGSTDNLSISSTASSASIMLRKMGKGMKKSTRSIKGLFRPKSVIGVPAVDGPVAQPSLGQVSMVTVEAEREKVNVNVNPHDQAGGGTGYPKLERNSLDAARAAVPDLPGSSHGPASSQDSRKSIVGGERERAEVLAAVKKGILKRTGTNSDTSSPISRPAMDNGNTETPRSSAPSTPNDDHKHVNIGGEDYFMGGPKFGNSSTRSLPNTPHGSRNISFSPRIQFHDAWSSSEYDRRGDIATCNRLTPMLAQQIKEELNSFKMEMEVHELSKPHTHFF